MYPFGAYIVKSTNGVCKIKDIVNPDFVADSNKLYYKANLSEEKDAPGAGKEKKVEWISRLTFYTFHARLKIIVRNKTP